VLLFFGSVGVAVVVELMALSDDGGDDERYGVMTGRGGIRGVELRDGFSIDEIAAYNRDGALQGLRGSSVSPSA